MKINKKEILETIKLLQEETMLNKEIRFTMDIKNFDSLKNHVVPDYRTDWYFNGYRIRVIHSRTPKPVWQKIMSASAGKAVKKKTIIGEQDKGKLDKTCNLKLHMVSKRPVVNGTELYLEKTEAFDPKSNKRISFYSTEAESDKDLKEVKLLLKIPGISNLRNLGEINNETLAKKLLK